METEEVIGKFYKNAQSTPKLLHKSTDTLILLEKGVYINFKKGWGKTYEGMVEDFVNNTEWYQHYNKFRIPPSSAFGEKMPKLVSFFTNGDLRWYPAHPKNSMYNHVIF